MKRHRCPDCGGPLVYGEGCACCSICGFTATASQAVLQRRPVGSVRPRRVFAGSGRWGSDNVQAAPRRSLTGLHSETISR